MSTRILFLSLFIFSALVSAIENDSFGCTIHLEATNTTYDFVYGKFFFRLR